MTDYTALITSEHRDKPRFVETVAATTAPFSAIQNVLHGLLRDFDIDHAVGVQLDIIGLWIGVLRDVPVPIRGVYFSWDDTVETGWDRGVWLGLGDPTEGFTELPDDLYRAVLRAKIRANNWKGDIPGAYEIVRRAFPNGHVTIRDNQDMTMTVTMDTASLAAVERAIISRGYLPIKPLGVTAQYIEE